MIVVSGMDGWTDGRYVLYVLYVCMYVLYDLSESQPPHQHSSVGLGECKQVGR